MVDLRIVDAPVLLQESITDDVKMPTGGLGNFSIRLGDIVWYVVTKEQLANKNYVDLSSKGVKDSLDEHIADKANPHQVTKEQVGLGDVDNTADIDKPVSNAVSSAIITATTDMATKTYVNQKDNLKADKATTLSGYGIVDAYTKDETCSRVEINSALTLKSDVAYVDGKDGDLTTLTTNDKTNLVKAVNEIHDVTKGVVALYDRNVEAGAGANGWDDTLVAAGENLNQRQVNDGIESIAQLITLKNPRNGQRVYVKSYHAGLHIGGGIFTLIDTTQVVDNAIVFASQDATKKWVRAEQTCLTPDMFCAKPNDPTFDNTEALNRAFATGRDIYGKKDDVYYVKGNIRTKGQRTIGGWKINSTKQTSRAGTWSKLVTTNDTGLDTSNNIRMLYVSSAWDLSEFLAIKELGFNTIHHYMGMHDIGWDRDGTVLDVLNNAKTAGLKVSVGTEQNALAKSDLTAFVNSINTHPAVWAYSVYDEPVARGFTVAQQDERITTLRNLTNKKLIAVDYESNPFVQKYSTNYDLVFVNSYSMRWATGDALAQDLDKMRRDYGVLKAQVKAPVIPAISAFTMRQNSMYASDVNQVVKASKIFAKVSGGNFAAFVWDGEADASINRAVRDNTVLQDLVKTITEQPQSKPLRTDVYLFGNANTQTDWGLNDIIKHIARPDPTSSDPMTINAYPIKIKHGTTDTDRTSTTSTMNYAGVGFKGANARLVTDIELHKYLKLHLEYVNVDGNVPFSTIIFGATNDGYNFDSVENHAVYNNRIIDGSYIVPSQNSMLAIKFFNTSAVIKDKYRQLIRGVIITSDW